MTRRRYRFLGGPSTIDGREIPVEDCNVVDFPCIGDCEDVLLLYCDYPGEHRPGRMHNHTYNRGADGHFHHERAYVSCFPCLERRAETARQLRAAFALTSIGGPPPPPDPPT